MSKSVKKDELKIFSSENLIESKTTLELLDEPYNKNASILSRNLRKTET